MKIAIIGTGISGLVTGYLLHRKHDISVYEASDYIGGHTNTIECSDGEGSLLVDTGFIVFNEKTYPNFCKLLGNLGIEKQPTAMSFSVKCGASGFEYNGTSINSLFAQRQNIFKPKMWHLIGGIFKFNASAKEFLKTNHSDLTLREFVSWYQLNEEVVKYYIIPMAASVWSADPKQMWDFPALFLLKFWANHGFLEINERPQWFVVKGGSHSYVKEIIKGFEDKIQLSTPVKSIHRENNKVYLTTDTETNTTYDAVIFATHSDQALNILDDPTQNEQSLLSAIPFQKNIVVLHTDASVLPESKRAIAAWNYYLPKEQSDLATLTYNMNILQSLKTKKSFNVSLNLPVAIDPSQIIKTITYHHPVFTLEGIRAQERYKDFMGEKNTFFTGAYLRNGFHEDGVVSALNVCAKFGESL